MAVCPCLLDAAQEFPRPVAAPEPHCESKLLEPQVAQSERQGESELLQEARSEQVLPWESSRLQEEPQPQAPQGAEQPTPLVPLPLLPEDVCALSPQHPRVSSSSASSFP